MEFAGVDGLSHKQPPSDDHSAAASHTGIRVLPGGGAEADVSLSVMKTMHSHDWRGPDVRLTRV